VECGTHVVVAADLAPYSVSERAMAAKMLPTKLESGMLLLADRGFYSFELYGIGCETGAMLAWRVSATINLDVVQELPVAAGTNLLFFSRSERACSSSSVFFRSMSLTRLLRG